MKYDLLYAEGGVLIRDVVSEWWNAALIRK